MMSEQNVNYLRRDNFEVYLLFNGNVWLDSTSVPLPLRAVYMLDS